MQVLECPSCHMPLEPHHHKPLRPGGGVWDCPNTDTVIKVEFLQQAAGRAASNQQQQQLRGENLLSALTQHPNIVRLLDEKNAQQTLIVTLERCDGDVLQLARSSSDSCGGGRLPSTTGQAILTQMALVLQSLHARNILHRDIKPENIFYKRVELETHQQHQHRFLQQDLAHALAAPPASATSAAAAASASSLEGGGGGGVAYILFKLGDFGHAILDSSQPASNYRSPSKTVGTYVYMAPEVVSGVMKTNNTADAWSLGASMYHLLTGEVPFDENTVVRAAESLARTANLDGAFNKYHERMPYVHQTIDACCADAPELALAIKGLLTVDSTRRLLALGIFAFASFRQEAANYLTAIRSLPTAQRETVDFRELEDRIRGVSFPTEGVQLSECFFYRGNAKANEPTLDTTRKVWFIYSKQDGIWELAGDQPDRAPPVDFIPADVLAMHPPQLDSLDPPDDEDEEEEEDAADPTGTFRFGFLLKKRNNVPRTPFYCDREHVAKAIVDLFAQPRPKQ